MIGALALGVLAALGIGAVASVVFALINPGGPPEELDAVSRFDQTETYWRSENDDR